MPKFIVVPAEMETQLRAIALELADPDDRKRFETRHINSHSITYTAKLALMAAYNDPCISFESVDRGYAFRMKVQMEGGETVTYSIRVKTERTYPSTRGAIT